ncbi:thiamine pyrophosphate-binding protein [bacterium]|nr:thiamine pyrophosphate-binding protein [bacterium]MBP9808265.1 thiamine pyrophosphate-binding protein [bacterium]
MTTSSTKLTCDLLLQQLLTEGASQIFVAPRSCNSPIAQALSEVKGFRQVNCASELTAAFMSIGYAQASSRAAVVLLSAGQGLVTALPAIYTASRIHVPMIVICDQLSTQILNDDPALGLDALAVSKSVCKWSAEARSAGEIPRLVRRAFTEAFSPPRGPIVLSIPVDILNQAADATIISPPHTSPLGAADNNFIQKSARTLVSASSPCIVAGNEVNQYRARKEAATLAEVIGCPVYSEPNPTGVNFPNRHPQFAGVLSTNITQARESLRGHDLVLALGMQCRLPETSDQASLISPRTSVLQINVDPTLSGKTLPCIAAATADIAESLSRLRAEIQLIADNNWLNTARKRTQDNIKSISSERQKLEENLVYPKENDPISLFWLLRSLDGARSSGSIVVTDIVGTMADPAVVMSLEGSSSYFASNSGVDGYAIGAALGTQWASPESTVVCITSDQSFLQTTQALWTAAHYVLNTKVILVNNGGSDSLNLHLGNADHQFPLDCPEIEFSQLAKAMTIQALKAETMGQLEHALGMMFDSTGPFLIDARIR